MLQYLVFAIFIILLIFKYEKASILIAVLACWLTLFRDPLNLVNNLYLSLSFIAALLGAYKFRKKILKSPFILCVVPVLVSYTITMYYYVFYSKQYLAIFAQFLFPCIIYCVIDRKERVILFVKYASILMILATLYCLFEETISANPIMHWCEKHPESFTWFHDRSEQRFGVKRAQSFFSGESAFGLTCSYIFIILFIMMRDGAKIMKVKWRKLLILLLPLCVFLTGTRSVILCFLVACVALLTPQTIKKYRIPLLAVGLVLIFFMGSYFTSLYNSIFVDSTEIGGSSSEMREGQWDIAYYYMNQDFWLGNGVHFTGKLLNSGGEAGLFGAEGMWLPVMMDRGMLGVICTLSAFLLGLYYILRRKRYNMIWLWISFLLMKTLTTGVGIELTYYEIVLIVLFRYAEFAGVCRNNTNQCEKIFSMKHNSL